MKQITYIFLIILILGIIGISGCLYTNNGSSNITEINKTDNGTYSVAGVSFKSPDG